MRQIYNFNGTLVDEIIFQTLLTKGAKAEKL